MQQHIFLSEHRVVHKNLTIHTKARFYRSSFLFYTHFVCLGTMRKRCDDDDENCEDCGISETPWVMYFLEAEFRFFWYIGGSVWVWRIGLEGGNRQAFKDIFSLSTITVSKDTHSAHFTSTGLEGLVF